MHCVKSKRVSRYKLVYVNMQWISEDSDLLFVAAM